jgi:2-amino-4-hydroxy-6-hydroxymethyldihydropteridine diphosphokinase
VIFIGLGANLPSRFGGPRETLEAALSALPEQGVRVVRVSPFYRTKPVPASDQPWFVNAVAEVETELSPTELLAALHRIEDTFGRVRAIRNEPRVVDLDLLDYYHRVALGQPILPHPRLHRRAFVLLPLRDLAPDWRHPTLKQNVAELIAQLPPDQTAEPLP